MNRKTKECANNPCKYGSNCYFLHTQNNEIKVVDIIKASPLSEKKKNNV